MSSPVKPITVTIMDKEYVVGCAEANSRSRRRSVGRCQNCPPRSRGIHDVHRSRRVVDLAVRCGAEQQ